MSIGNKILIIGPGGSGKSTLARQLGEKHDLPVIHLDKEFWNAGWVQTPKEEWHDKQKMLLSGPCWIADGNFGGSLELRLERADTVIFLDFSRFASMRGVIKRRFSNIGKTRPCMADGCPEKLDFAFLKWLWQFPSKSRPQILEIISNCRDVDVIVLRNRKEVRRFLVATHIS